MERELIINALPKGVEVALLEDKALVELHQENKNNAFSVGDVFLGKIRKVMPGLNAAFVDVGYQKDAFLHYSDLGENIKTSLKYVENAVAGKQKSHLLNYVRFEKEIAKGGKIDDVLSKKEYVLVQVLKEPISTKGPRLTADVTLPGRNIVLVPFSNTIGISKKILSRDERNRLKKLMESILPKNFGVVVRTVAQGKSVAELHEDLNSLMDKWKQILERLEGQEPPAKILGEINKTSTFLRDYLNASFNSIVTNDQKIYEEVKDYVVSIAPDKEKIISFYTSSKPLYDFYNITRQIKSAFGKTVNIKGGAYLIIEHTEALHVIDVNSGHKVSSEGSQESTAISVNMEAAAEVARQLRLRDLGGIIIIDFIDMKNPGNRKQLQDKMHELMKSDKAKHTILPLSKFGLMQITRQRVKPEVKISTMETCPSCDGTGQVSSTLLLAEKIENDVRYLLKEQNQSSIKLVVHPIIEAFLKQGGWLRSIQWKWYFKYKKKVNIYTNDDYGLIEYHFYDKNGEEIELS